MRAEDVNTEDATGGYCGLVVRSPLMVATLVALILVILLGLYGYMLRLGMDAFSIIG